MPYQKIYVMCATIATAILLTILPASAAENSAAETQQGRSVAVSFYLDGTDNVPSTQEYLECAYQLVPGLSIAAGTSIQDTEHFKYLLVDVHAESNTRFSPFYQVGYAAYYAHQEIDADNKREGLILGLGVAYPINQFSSLKLISRRLNHHWTLQDSVEYMLSLGASIRII